ncbi:MAG: LPS-assembly protein LptD [Sedimentitalea sp.]
MRGALTFLLWLLPALAFAQDAPAVLVADSVFVTPDRRLVAEGNVEAFQGDTRISAQKIEFDRENGTLVITGPIRIDEGGDITILANAAELDRGLQNGILTGARMVLDEQLQLAALQMTRVGGRYTQLYKTAVTSCFVCENGRPPLWQIRARRITHDQQERQLYFEDAQFLIYDTPVLYFPGLRLPDPTLERANGFLIPSVRTTSNLGTGLKVPYFFRLGDHADLTLSPYLSSRTRTLDYRYRQAFRRGGIVIDGAYTRDDLLPGQSRWYIFGQGRFALPRNYNLDLDLQATSDNAYLVDYGLPDLDRLQNQIALSRYKRAGAFRARLIYYDSLRDSDDETILPRVVGDIFYERRFFPTAVGGEARVSLDVHGHHRNSELDVLGRDINRGTLDLSWERHWILRGGLRLDWMLGFAADAFKISQDSTFERTSTRTTPRSALTLSYPMITTTRSGATHLLEPVFQLGWSDVRGPAVPNDESRFVEFDQGNLLEMSRFPANDRREDGRAIVYGLNWTRTAAGGWQALATLGRVVRQSTQPDFTQTSGLSGTTSDLLVAGQLKLDKGLALTGRALLDDKFLLSKAELRGDWSSERAGLSGTYLWLGADTVEGRSRALSELWVNGRYEVSQGWTANASLRYDISDARATRAGLGLVYRNECVTFDLRVNRRYTSSTSVDPSTDFGFTIALSGFSVDRGTEKYRRSCS